MLENNSANLTFLVLFDAFNNFTYLNNFELFELFNTLTSYLSDDTFYLIYNNSCCNALYDFLFFNFWTCGFNLFYGLFFIKDVPFSYVFPHVFPLPMPSPFHGFYFNFYFYLGSLDQDFDFYFSTLTWSSSLPWWLGCLGKRDRDNTHDLEMPARRSTDERGWRLSDLDNWGRRKSDPNGWKRYNAGEEVDYNYGYNTPVNCKGKGKEKEIPNDKELSNEISKESLDSGTSFSSTSTTSSVPNSYMSYKSYPKTPQNTPSSSSDDIRGSGCSGFVDWVSNLLEKFI